MRQKFIFKILLTFFPVIAASCMNEEGGNTCSNTDKITIHASIQDKSLQSRASDVVAVEYIKRYDTFIFNTSDGALVDYKGRSTPPTSPDQFTEEFLAGADYLTTKDVYVVVNNSNWNGKTEDEMKAITRNELESMELACTQNYSGTSTAMTNFDGYKKSATENEPFVMTVSSKAHNFQTTPTLNMLLKRTYAKVVLKIISAIPENEDHTDWVSLKTLTVKRINNIADKVKLFNTTGAGYTPVKSSYEWADEYKKAGNDADLKTGYIFDTFTEDNLRLRIFPHAPASNTDYTSIEVGFGVGPAGKNQITKEFFRKIEIGKAEEQYRIDPNSAYIVTIRYGKTDSGLIVSTEVVPWYIINYDGEVYPE